jgi:transcriptional regulator with XRE-family HTH domain
MGTTLKDKMAQLLPERRAAVEAEAARLQTEYLTLQDLRKARKLTQGQLAQVLGKSQVTIAQMEKRSDLLLSTLRSYVEAMGGHLNLTVEFPDREPVQIEGLSDIDAEIPHKKSRQKIDHQPA